MATIKPTQHAIRVVLRKPLLQCGFRLSKRAGRPPAAFNVGAKLCVGMRELVSEHDDRQILDAATDPIRHQSDDAPVKPNSSAVDCLFVSKQISHIVFVHTEEILANRQHFFEWIVLIEHFEKRRGPIRYRLQIRSARRCPLFRIG